MNKIIAFRNRNGKARARIHCRAREPTYQVDHTKWRRVSCCLTWQIGVDWWKVLSLETTTRYFLAGQAFLLWGSTTIETAQVWEAGWVAELLQHGELVMGSFDSHSRGSFFRFWSFIHSRSLRSLVRAVWQDVLFRRREGVEAQGVWRKSCVCYSAQ